MQKAMNMMIMSRIIYVFLTALAVWSCSPETQGYVIPGPNQTITPTPVHEEQDPVKPALEFYSISCGPGEDASNSMTVSWAVDSTKVRSYVQYTKVNDTDWKKAATVQPEHRNGHAA